MLPLIQNFFSTYVPGGTSGSIQGYNVYDGSPLPTAIDTPSSVLGTTASWELGYKGLLGDKFALTVDICILIAGKPGKVVSLCADMYSLPVKEKLDLHFAS